MGMVCRRTELGELLAAELEMAGLQAAPFTLDLALVGDDLLAFSLSAHGPSLTAEPVTASDLARRYLGGEGVVEIDGCSA